MKLLTIKKMKKILGTLVLFLAFTLNASAQDKAFKKVDAAVEAKKNVTEMAEYLKLNSEDVENSSVYLSTNSVYLTRIYLMKEKQN